MRSDWISDDVFGLLLSACMPENRLALLVSMTTGLRIGDVLRLRPADIITDRPTITEAKTHKRRRVYIPLKLREQLARGAGRFWVFPGRLDERKPRTRQAVYKDLRRVAKLYRLDGKVIRAHVSPHSARKIYAVKEFHKGGLKHVQALLQHDSEAVTMLYAMADQLTKQRAGG